MAGLIYIALSVVSLLLWKYGFCSICSELDIGFWGRPWYLWGAIFYSIVGTFAIYFKRNWYVGIIMACGTLFHGLLIFKIMMPVEFCYTCLLLLIAELVTIIIYISKENKPKNKLTYLLFGFGISTIIVGIIAFAFNPTSNNMAEGTEKAANEVEYKKVTPADSQISKTVTTVKDVQEGGSKKPQSTFGPTIKVYTPSGTQTELDLRDNSALIFAWWCSHCDQALQEISQSATETRPYLVVTYLKGDDQKFIEQKLQANGLGNEPYYLFYDIPPFESIPTTVWWTEDQLKTANGLSLVERPKKLLSKARIDITNDNGGKNAILGVQSLDGAVVPPGSVFSFNQVVGERTEERGYKTSGVIEGDGNGGYTYAKGVGGGVCRTSTVLHWAVQDAGLEVVESHKHSLPVAYGKVREDAAVAWPYADYKFRNNTDAKVTLKSIIGERWIEIEIWKG